MKPKWGVRVGAFGTHNICVCTYHQNGKLLVDVIKWDETYKDLFKLLVCNTENAECMLYRCSNCPRIEALIAHLKYQLKEFDDEEEISFKW